MWVGRCACIRSKGEDGSETRTSVPLAGECTRRELDKFGLVARAFFRMAQLGTIAPVYRLFFSLCGLSVWVTLYSPEIQTGSGTQA